MDKREIEFQGRQAIEITTQAARMVVVTASGPRIAFFGRPDGENLLFWDRDDLSRGDWKLMGGHRVWSARPMADESEDAYRPDNGACRVEESEEDSLVITSARDDELAITRGFVISLEDESTVSVENFISNAGDMLYSASVWALTCTRPAADTTYRIPLGDHSEWDCFNLVMFRRWGGGHTSPLNDPQIAFTEDELVLTPQGIETKRMLQAPAGLFTMRAPDRRVFFSKQVEYRSDASYPLGCNLAFYVGPDNFMVEMESMGPEMTLKPGETVYSREVWKIGEYSA